MQRFAVSLFLFLALCSTDGGAATLKPETVTAWEHYIAAVDASAKTAVTNEGSFLWIDKEPSRLADVKHGKVVVSQIRRGNGPAIPNGLIHDWLGALFVPDASIAGVFAVTRNYEKYPAWYGPTITRGSLRERSGNTDHFTIHYVRRVLFVTAVMDADYDTQYVEVNANRWYSIGRSTRMQEMDQDDRPGQKKTATNDGSGYLWRAYTLTRYEQRDNGVYIEQESIGLSRPIPSSLRWMVEPVVKRLAKDLLATSLEQTREAIAARSVKETGTFR